MIHYRLAQLPTQIAGLAAHVVNGAVKGLVGLFAAGLETDEKSVITRVGLISTKMNTL